MARNTQKAILETAKALFNERGYDNVSVREISEALEISKGNLTYYFKKKEDIVEAILESGTDLQNFEGPKTLKELDSFIKKMQQIVQENAFYFGYYTQLANLSPKIFEMQKNAIKVITKELNKGFNSLADQGYMEKERYPGEYEGMIEALMLSNIYWIPFNKLKGNATTKEFSKHAWQLLYGLLSEKSKSELAKS